MPTVAVIVCLTSKLHCTPHSDNPEEGSAVAACSCVSPCESWPWISVTKAGPVSAVVVASTSQVGVAPKFCVIV